MAKRKAVHESSEYTCKLGDMELKFRHMSLRERDVFLKMKVFVLNKLINQLNNMLAGLLNLEGDDEVPDSKTVEARYQHLYTEAMEIVDLVGLGDTPAICKGFDGLMHVWAWSVVIPRILEAEVSLATGEDVPEQKPIPTEAEVDNLSAEETESLGKDSPPKPTAQTS
jgi:hypothetical protein